MDWEEEWTEKKRAYLEEQLHDAMGLHLQVCLGCANKVPNLELGGLDSIEYYEFANMAFPRVSCPNPECGSESFDGES